MRSSATDVDARAETVRCSEDELIVSLADGRRIAVPLTWYPRLLNATPSQRSNWQLLGDGHGIHWPDADEDISVAGLLRGERSAEADPDKAR